MEETAIEKEIKKERKEMEKNPTIYDLLKLEHKDVKNLFKQIVDEESFQGNVYEQIRKALMMHMEGEEKLIYPRLQNAQETRSATLEAFEEHDLARKVMSDIDESSDEETKLAKVKVLSETISHHIEEEEGELFKKSKKVLSSFDEHDLAKQFMAEKMNKLPAL
ncbi:MAG: hemerythrin domain-containing protein [Candidatus Bathyarchaeota archaeon]|nr:hemerythrin domain-containing protein [Candidatus Bathyarchaeota archaeon]